MIFGRNKAASGLSADQVERIEAAAAALRIDRPRWGRDAAVFHIAGSARPAPFEDLARALGPHYHGLRGPFADAVGLAAAIGAPLPPESAAEWAVAREVVLPRLFNESSLQGPRRNMCRRPVFGNLIRAIALGDGLAAPLVTTAILDQWQVTFDEVWESAERNLLDRLTPDTFDDVAQAVGLKTLVDVRTPGSSGAFVVADLCPEAAEAEGVVFSVPRAETLLALPVEPDSGMEGLAALVQATHALVTEADDVLSDQLFWWNRGTTVLLPMTLVFENGSRRIQIEADGPVGRLLHILGVID